MKCSRDDDDDGDSEASKVFSAQPLVGSCPYLYLVRLSAALSAARDGANRIMNSHKGLILVLISGESGDAEPLPIHFRLP